MTWQGKAASKLLVCYYPFKELRETPDCTNTLPMIYMDMAFLDAPNETGMNGYSNALYIHPK